MTNKKNDEIKNILDQMVPDKDEGSQVTFNHIDSDRDFVGGNHNIVGNSMANRDINHNNVVNNNIANSRPVTMTERRKLHRLVKQLEEQYGEPGAKTWKSIHDILGIDNVESMLLEQLKPTETILNLLIANAKLRHAPNQPNSIEQSLRQQVEQSANALTKLTERNGELAVNLKKYQDAHGQLTKYRDGYAILDTKCKKQAGEIEGLSTQLSVALEKSRRIGVAQVSISTARRRFVLASIFGAVAVIAATVLGIQNVVLTRQLHATEDRLSVCEFEDKSYAIGSVLPTNYKCVIVGQGMPPQWSAMTMKPEKKNAQQKQPTAQQKYSEESEAKPSLWKTFNLDEWFKRIERKNEIHQDNDRRDVTFGK